MNSSRPSLEQIFETHIQTLCLSLRPNTVAEYRYIGRRFFAYLRMAFPEVHRLSQLRRDPHLLSWFPLAERATTTAEQHKPVSTISFASGDYCIVCRPTILSNPNFIRREDFPVQPQLSSQTAFSPGGPTLAAGIEANR